MNHLIILPGESELDSAWATRVASRFGLSFDTIYSQTYSHWGKDPQKEFDLVIEIEKLRSHLASLPADTMVVIFAKYLGAILALSAGELNSGLVKQAFLFGPSFDWANRHIFVDDFSALEKYQIPTTVFHSQHDPASSYVHAKETVEQHCPAASFITTSGFEFTYNDYFSYAKHISPILNSLGMVTAPIVA
jgi:hypothetical protein